MWGSEISGKREKQEARHSFVRSRYMGKYAPAYVYSSVPIGMRAEIHRQVRRRVRHHGHQRTCAQACIHFGVHTLDCKDTVAVRTSVCVASMFYQYKEDCLSA